MAFTIAAGEIPLNNRPLRQFVFSRHVTDIMERDGYKGVAAIERTYRNESEQLCSGWFLAPYDDPREPLYLIAEKESCDGQEHPFMLLPRSRIARSIPFSEMTLWEICNE